MALAVERLHALVGDALDARVAKRADRDGAHNGVVGLEALAVSVVTVQPCGDTRIRFTGAP